MHSVPYHNNYLFVFISLILCFPYVLLHRMVFVDMVIFDNQQIYYLINLYFFVACLGQLKSVLTRYLVTLLGFQNYELLDFILQRDLFNRIFMEHSGNIPIFNIPGTLFGNIPRNVWNLFQIFRECHGNVPRIFHKHIFARWVAQVPSCELCEFYRNTFFTEHLRVNASDAHHSTSPLFLNQFSLFISKASVSIII